MEYLKRTTIPFLAAVLLVGFTLTATAQDRGTAVQAFNKALELAKSNQYQEAIDMYNQAIAQAAGYCRTC
jgi:tetratricopeptide (TPR) repeat protein